MSAERTPGAPYVLRPITKFDLDVVLRHRRQMFVDMKFETTGIEAAMASAAIVFGGALAEGRYRGFFVEESDGRVVAGGGVITNRFHTGPRDSGPQRAWIVNVYTEPERRRQGLARLIVESLIDLARELEWPAIFLHASEEGRPLYESMGFQPTAEMVLRLR